MWLRQAASEGHARAAYEAAHLLLHTDPADALELFLLGARHGHAGAMFNAAHMLSSGSEEAAHSLLALTRAVLWFGRAASQPEDAKVAADAQIAVARVRRLWVQRVERADVRALTPLFEALLSDEATPMGVTREGALPYGHEEAPPSSRSARDPEPIASQRLVAAREQWSRGVSSWESFEVAFSEHPSYDNQAALASLRRAMGSFELALHAGPHSAQPRTQEGLQMGRQVGRGAETAPLGEMGRYLLLSKLAEGAKTLARRESELARGVYWLEALVRQPLCAELYAETETQPSCFNDQLASAITMRRRMNDTASADGLLRMGHAHPHAATRWNTSAQTPRVFSPHLEAMGWWDASRFPVTASLEAAWQSGAIAADLAHIDRALPTVGTSGTAPAPTAAAPVAVAPAADGAPMAAEATVSSASLPRTEQRPLQSTASAAGSGSPDRFSRIVSAGAPIQAAPGADDDLSGVWSEFMLFDGVDWLEERCALAVALCAALRAAPEVSGEVTHPDGTLTKPQGQVTIFRLRPGARVLPHVGVTNRRLVLQFPLRGWHGVRFRVDDEWRSCALATRLPRACHALATRLPRACHALATRSPRTCHALATRLPRACHALATRATTVNPWRRDPQPGFRASSVARCRAPHAAQGACTCMHMAYGCACGTWSASHVLLPPSL